LVQAELIKLLRYLTPSIIKIINISALLMCDFENRPQSLTLSLSIMWIKFRCENIYKKKKDKNKNPSINQQKIENKLII
jgi:hypothetical protein